MAVYPEGNPGAFPIDPSTDIGVFRYAYGDTSSVPYDPPVSGIQNFSELSDDEIRAFLTQSEGSVPRGIGYLYLAMAGKASQQAISISDFDLRVDQTKLADSLRAQARFWFDQADNDDLIAGEDAFEIVPTGKSCSGTIPEGTIPVWGRAYDWRRGQREC